MNYRVSIVIIGRNEETSIGKCIDAALVAAEQIGGAEMIYVDSNSTDNTIAEVRERAVNVVMLDPNRRACPSAGRFAGSTTATGEYILFLDADTLIYTDFLRTAIDHFDADTTLGGVNGCIDDFTEAGEQVFEIDERSDDVMEVKWLRGPACFYRREALINAGSFNPNLAMEEEAELGLRLVAGGWKLNVIPQPMARHTRCFHGHSLESVVSTFRRDLRSKRIGEITRTIAYAFRAGNGFAFCWLRLKTTILFSAWLLGLALCTFLPKPFYPTFVAASLVLLGGLAIFVKKRSLSQTLLFIPAKLLNLVDILAGINKVRVPKSNNYGRANGSLSLR